MLARGSTIGILGAGQLGRMMAMSAAQLGYRTIGYAPEGDNVSASVNDGFVTAEWDDEAALTEFAQRCDVVTWEFENVPVATARAISQAKIFPDPLALETAQDRLNEKRFIEGLGGRPAAYARVDWSSGTLGGSVTLPAVGDIEEFGPLQRNVRNVLPPSSPTLRPDGDGPLHPTTVALEVL